MSRVRFDLVIIALWTVLCLVTFAWTYTDDFKQRISPEQSQ